ncbi:GGDEF domain-containing protein [Sulfobacillus thermosulfidooxidans]|uniref:GGDEF domain-containing protein n=1 Tax=Sulfobacillus thermosulfidooxidans TaxID=28034 RepID=UPI0006B6611A|nr:GGDEF domain-containing protein [Sulfobacillus thermosulfidooxidans]
MSGNVLGVLRVLGTGVAYAIVGWGVVHLAAPAWQMRNVVPWGTICVLVLFTVWWQYLAVPSFSFTRERSVHNFVPALYILIWVRWGMGVATWVALGHGAATILYRWAGPRVAQRHPTHPLVRWWAVLVNDTPQHLQRMGQSWVPYVQNATAAVLFLGWLWWWRGLMPPGDPTWMHQAGRMAGAVIAVITANNYLGVFLLSPLLPQRDAERLWRSTIWWDSIPVSVVESILALLLIGAWPVWSWGALALIMVIVHRMASQLTQQRRLLEQEYWLQREREAARTDPLTGLPNRRSLEEYAAQVTTEGLPAVIALLDIDHFKHVNDTWGHDVGDHVLKVVAERARQACRTDRAPWPDMVGRWGGEEFVLVLPQMPDAAAPGRVETIRRAISQPVRLESGQILAVTASMGAYSVTHHPWDLTHAVKHADQGLYQAKAHGRHQAWWQGSQDSEPHPVTGGSRFPATDPMGNSELSAPWTGDVSVHPHTHG